MKRIWGIFFALVLLLSGVATVHAALYFPHVATTGGWQTEICVINPSSTVTVTGNLVSYGNNGSQVATRTLTVAPNNRVQFDVGSELANASSTGYVVYQNTSGSPVGYTKFTQSGGDRVAIPAADSVNTDKIYVTHIAWAPWWTGISLVNTTAATKTLTIRFNTGATRTITLAPGEHYVNTIAAILDNLIDTTVESAVIENADGIVGLELFGNGMQLGGVPLISGTASTLYFPHVASDAEWWTGLVAYNPSTTAAPIIVNAYNAAGTLLRSSSTSIPAGGRFFGPSTLPALDLPAGTAWFSIQSQKPLVGFELFGTHDGRRLAGFSTVDLESEGGIFPKVEKSGWTGIAFVNTEDQEATVYLTPYDNTGGLAGPAATKDLNKHEKWVGTVEQLFPGVNLSAATYLSFSADRKVAGFQLNNSTDNTKLDALPAASPSGLKVVNKALDFFKYQETITSGMGAVMDIAFTVLFSEPGGTCPAVTVNPPLGDGLSVLPPAITITANYGSGCMADDGSTMSGQVVLAITNLTQTGEVLETGSMNFDYALTATNLRQDGEVLLNGSVSGHVAYTSTDSVITANATVHFNNFQVPDSTISGNLTLAASISNLLADTPTINISIAFDNLTAAGYTVSSGTLTVTNTTIDANLVTSQGVVDLTLTVQSPSETTTVVSTASPGTIAGYTVTLTNVTLNTSVCASYPSSGSVTVSQGGSTVTVSFTPADCPDMSMLNQVMERQVMGRAHPTYDLNPWPNVSKGLFKLMTPKK